jgi:tetratricopeptide (TPR) repeat protein
MRRLTLTLMLAAAALLITCGTAPRVEARQATASPAPPAAINEAFTALYSGDPDRALQLASNFLKQHPTDLGALVIGARAHLARNEPQPAYVLLRRAILINPRDPDALYFLGIAAAELAAREFERVRALAPDGARVHQLMARSLKMQEKLAEAAAEYELALQKDPKLTEALLELAMIRREETNCDEAVRLYERAERIVSSFEATYGLGACFSALNQHTRAVDAFRKALAFDPRSAVAHFGLGDSLLKSGDVASAVRALERATTLQPAMRQAHYLLGRAYREMNMPERSRQAFARAEELAKAERSPKRP